MTEMFKITVCKPDGGKEQHYFEKYPEHEKVHANMEESRHIGRFIEWLHENEMLIATRDRRDALIEDDRGIEAILATYFDIDLAAFHEEKDRMYDELVRANEERAAS